MTVADGPSRGGPRDDRAARRRERRRALRRRRLLAAGVVSAVVVAVIALLASGGGSAGAGRRTAHDAATATASSATTTAGTAAATTKAAETTTTPAPPPKRRAASDPGSLPQTEAFPSSHTRHFRALMAALWRGVVRDSPAAAVRAFFPRRAYEQLKAIGAPGADWENRLVRDYGLDIGAAHRLLGTGAANARLLGVQVVRSYGHWVPPGACYNSVGYFEVPNARVVYSEGGAVRSFGIASMISWRGVWYVVHMGAVLREGGGGVVDEPSTGPGQSVYSGTC